MKEKIKTLICSYFKDLKTPVELEKLIEQQGNIFLYYADLFTLKNLEGISLLADKTANGGFQYYILINSSLPPLRQRFTVAHEFGHIMLDHLNENVRCQTFVGREDANIVLKIREREANIFASELLMPEELFRQYHKEGATLTDLSLLFRVSLAAAKIRLEELGLE